MEEFLGMIRDNSKKIINDHSQNNTITFNNQPNMPNTNN